MVTSSGRSRMSKRGKCRETNDCKPSASSGARTKTIRGYGWTSRSRRAAALNLFITRGLPGAESPDSSAVFAAAFLASTTSLVVDGCRHPEPAPVLYVGLFVQTEAFASAVPELLRIGLSSLRLTATGHRQLLWFLPRPARHSRRLE